MSNIKGRFPTAMDMINQLIAAEAAHALLKQLQHYATPDLLVCDEWRIFPSANRGRISSSRSSANGTNGNPP
jgi:hypothetical protein